MSSSNPIVYFDGVCIFCSAAVHFIIDRDPHAHFGFAPLQSEAGKRVLRELGRPASDLDTVILRTGGRTYTRSSAALHIARHMRFPWPLLTVFLLVPSFVRDLFYRYFARNRYRWFGKTDACMVPTPELRQRFVE